MADICPNVARTAVSDGILPLPELLAPAGSPEALQAAVAAGADAVYFGGGLFHARQFAQNFDDQQLKEAIRFCAFHGVKSHIVLNTLIDARQMDQALHRAAFLYEAGADALIVADLGLASLIHRTFPDFALHASTQLSGQQVAAAEMLSKVGFSRMVCAREASADDLRYLCQHAPIEIEMFIHGALCVSLSGQCLFSAMLDGARSGNCGTCAQPCRLSYQYTSPFCKESVYHTYAGAHKEERNHRNSVQKGPDASRRATTGELLSLKDLCLAKHITRILSLGVRSLKIEGRMKSPAYVYAVTKCYRMLLDERRDADVHEVENLASLFSRSGFTDGYFTGKINRTMCGVRTEQDKQNTVVAEKQAINEYRRVLQNGGKKHAVWIHVTLQPQKPATMEMRCGTVQITVCGDIVQTAQQTPLRKADVEKQMQKLGGTPFACDQIEVTLHGACRLPVAALNALRRTGTEALYQAILTAHDPHRVAGKEPLTDLRYHRDENPVETTAVVQQRAQRVGCFFSLEQMTTETACRFDRLYIPLEQFCADPAGANAYGVTGVILPPFAFDTQVSHVRQMMQTAARAGARMALCGVPGHALLASEAGLEVHGSYRCNVYNPYSADVLKEMQFTRVCVSPELCVAQIRDLQISLPKGAVVYGRLPLMTLRRCLLHDAPGGCAKCRAATYAALRDRTGTCFPILPMFGHANLLCNALPFYMADRPQDLLQMDCDDHYFLFLTETQREVSAVLDSWERGAPAPFAARRLPRAHKKSVFKTAN